MTQANPFQVEPPCIGHYREYPPGVHCVHQNKNNSILRYFTLLCLAAFSASSFFSDSMLT